MWAPRRLALKLASSRAAWGDLNPQQTSWTQVMKTTFHGSVSCETRLSRLGSDEIVWFSHPLMLFMISTALSSPAREVIIKIRPPT